MALKDQDYYLERSVVLVAVAASEATSKEAAPLPAFLAVLALSNASIHAWNKGQCDAKILMNINCNSVYCVWTKNTNHLPWKKV